MKAARKKAREEESISMPVRIQVWLSACVHARDWNRKLLKMEHGRSDYWESPIVKLCDIFDFYGIISSSTQGRRWGTEYFV